MGKRGQEGGLFGTLGALILLVLVVLVVWFAFGPAILRTMKRATVCEAISLGGQAGVCCMQGQSCFVPGMAGRRSCAAGWQAAPHGICQDIGGQELACCIPLSSSAIAAAEVAQQQAAAPLSAGGQQTLQNEEALLQEAWNLQMNNDWDAAIQKYELLFSRFTTAKTRARVLYGKGLAYAGKCSATAVPPRTTSDCENACISFSQLGQYPYHSEKNAEGKLYIDLALCRIFKSELLHAWTQCKLLLQNKRNTMTMTDAVC